jgi:hypothetical protein
VNPSPSPIDVVVHSSPAEWWQVLAALGPLAVLLGAVLAALIGWNTLRQRTAGDARALAQKREADNRAEWWKRTQWALDSSLSEDPRRAELGLGIMAVLADSGLASSEELKIMTVAWEEPLEVAEETIAVESTPDDGAMSAAETRSAVDGIWQTTVVDGNPKPGNNETTTEQKE